MLLHPERLRRRPAGGEPGRTGCSAATTERDTRRTTRYDFKGNLAAGTRQLAANYDAALNWTPLASLNTAAALDAAAAAAGLVPVGDGGQDKLRAPAYDALNRPVHSHAALRR